MKKLLLLFLFTSFVTFAQIPANYYDTATGAGYTLKTQLRNIVAAGHTDQGYNGLYTAYPTTHSDNDYEDDGSVLDFYSEIPSGTDSYFYTHGNNQCGNYSGEGDCYNREHLMPQSVFSEAYPMRSDVHHVIPTDGRVNGFRGSYAFGVVGTSLISQSGITNPTSNGSKLGNCISPGYTGTVFEPIDEFKGDIARALLYFAVRYENQIDSWSHVMLNGTSDQVYDDWFLDVLLDWHANDPVAQSEIDRNNAAYNYQGNANPFVDHPEYAAMIWNPTPDTEDPSAATNLVASNPTSTTIDLTWDASTDNVAVTSYDIYVDDVNTYNTSNTTFTAIGLSPETNYCFKIYAKDAADNTSVASNEDCETTVAGSSGGSELFLSEYVEGSGVNKLLEVANFTGVTVDLSTYELKLAFNGNSWTTTYSFPTSSEITNNDVYVIANGGNTLCTGEVDDLNNGITSFNGNDAVGLFKNGTLIDIIGVLSSSSDFAKDVTLVRKSTVVSPTTTYDSNEWDSYAQNTCDNIGSHSFSLSVDDYSLANIKMYPNPSFGDILNIITNDDLDITVYDLLGKEVLVTKVSATTNQIDISKLNRGIYMIRLYTEQGSITKKFIKQ